MTIVDKLSSRVGDRTQAATLSVAAECLADPSLLPEIVRGLGDKDGALVADCAEVFTRVAMERPDLAARYADALTPLLSHKTTRARWEAMHTLALVASVAPQVITPLLPQVERLMRTDKSIIVRDYAVDTLGNYAGTSPQAASTAYPLLKDALTVWEGRHAGRALEGLARVARTAPERAFDILGLAQSFLNDKRAVVRKAAKTAVKAAEGA